MLKIIDIYYLLNNESFVAFLKNIKEITIHESDFINLPKPLKHNKLFIKKVLNYKLELYESIGKSLQTDPEITDWVLSLKPQLAECLSVGQFHRLDTTNLHPATRKVIYRKYLSKSSAAGDVLEHAHMKQKLLQTNLQNEQAA